MYVYKVSKLVLIFVQSPTDQNTRHSRS